MRENIIVIIILIPIAGFICAIVEDEIKKWKYRNGKKDKFTYGEFLKELKQKKQEEKEREKRISKKSKLNES